MKPEEKVENIQNRTLGLTQKDLLNLLKTIEAFELVDIRGLIQSVSLGMKSLAAVSDNDSGVTTPQLINSENWDFKALLDLLFELDSLKQKGEGYLLNISQIDVTNKGSNHPAIKIMDDLLAWDDPLTIEKNLRETLDEYCFHVDSERQERRERQSAFFIISQTLREMEKYNPRRPK